MKSFENQLQVKMSMIKISFADKVNQKGDGQGNVPVLYLHFTQKNLVHPSVSFS